MLEYYLRQDTTKYHTLVLCFDPTDMMMGSPADQLKELDFELRETLTCDVGTQSTVNWKQVYSIIHCIKVTFY